MTNSTQMRTKQAAGLGIGSALALVLAWGLGEAGLDVPDMVTAAMSVIIGWGVSKLDGTPQ